MTSKTEQILNKCYDISMMLFTKGMHLHPLQTGALWEQLWVGKTGSVNFFIYREKQYLICFDTGFGKNIIKRELNKIDMQAEEITHLFLTHSDYDHADGIDLFKNAETFLSFEEEPLITGREARMLGIIHNFKIDRPCHLLRDNETIMAGPVKIQAISTPGHTSGSMSYLINESILLVGDTFKLVDGLVYPKRAYINMNTEQQVESIRKLARLDHVSIACTAHNGCTTTFDQAIKPWK